MDITTTKKENSIYLKLDGRLDTITSPQLEKELLNIFKENNYNLIFDFQNLVYISSAGLRVILSAQKKVNANQGSMIIKNVDDMVMEVFEMTGFVDILTIE